MPFPKWQTGLINYSHVGAGSTQVQLLKMNAVSCFLCVSCHWRDFTLNISNMELELIKQNVDWYIANCFKFKIVNICLQSFLSSRLSPSNPAVWEYSLCFLWSECDCPLGWGSRLYSFRAMPCLSDNYTIYCLSWSGCDVSAGCLRKRM